MESGRFVGEFGFGLVGFHVVSLDFGVVGFVWARIAEVAMLEALFILTHLGFP